MRCWRRFEVNALAEHRVTDRAERHYNASVTRVNDGEARQYHDCERKAGGDGRDDFSDFLLLFIFLSSVFCRRIRSFLYTKRPIHGIGVWVLFRSAFRNPTGRSGAAVMSIGFSHILCEIAPSYVLYNGIQFLICQQATGELSP